jgi:predicted esterase
MEEHRLTTTRRARYYTSGGDHATDVWIVCHGFGQLAAPFARPFARLASSRRRIVAPEALNRFYLETGPGGSHATARVGTTWMTREDRDNEIADYVDWLDAVHAAAVPQGARVTALGFSQGVATAARWVAFGRSRVDRLVLWAGALPPDLDLALLTQRLEQRPLVLVHGTSDEYGSWVEAEDMRARLAAAGLSVEELTFEGGHRLDDAVLDHLAAC